MIIFNNDDLSKIPTDKLKTFCDTLHYALWDRNFYIAHGLNEVEMVKKLHTELELRGVELKYGIIG
jgi:hypothetical protein